MPKRRQVMQNGGKPYGEGSRPPICRSKKEKEAAVKPPFTGIKPQKKAY